MTAMRILTKKFLHLLLVIAAPLVLSADGGGSIRPLAVDGTTHKAITADRNEILSLYNTSIPHIVYGDTGWQTTFIFHNPSVFVEEFDVWFYGDYGMPAYVPIVGGMYTGMHVQIQPMGTLKMKTDYNPALPSSWCMGNVDSLTGNFKNTYMQTIFKLTLPGQSDAEAAVPPEGSVYDEQVLVFDQEEGFVMGVALANPFWGTNVQADIYDEDGIWIGSHVRWMPATSHAAFALSTEYPETNNRVGTVV